MSAHAEFCGECFEDFRYDDIGGYNPPCACRFKCQHCCDIDCHEKDDESEDHDDAGECIHGIGWDEPCDRCEPETPDR